MKPVIFYSVITFSYTKCFVHSYTVDVVFTLSYSDISPMPIEVFGSVRSHLSDETGVITRKHSNLGKICFHFCDLELWPLTLTFYMDICQWLLLLTISPDSKAHGANMEPTWVLSAPDGPHVGPMNLAIRVMTGTLSKRCDRRTETDGRTRAFI